MAKRRGSESARDMLLSLSGVLPLVFLLWFLGQPPASDERPLQVDVAADLERFSASSSLPVPDLPAEWRPTSLVLAGPALRVGYVTPGGQYGEFAAHRGGDPTWLEGVTGPARLVRSLEVEGVTWELHEDRSGHQTLVRALPAGTLAVGGLRESTSLEELVALAASLR